MTLNATRSKILLVCFIHVLHVSPRHSIKVFHIYYICSASTAESQISTRSPYTHPFSRCRSFRGIYPQRALNDIEHKVNGTPVFVLLATLLPIFTLFRYTRDIPRYLEFFTLPLATMLNIKLFFKQVHRMTPTHFEYTQYMFIVPPSPTFQYSSLYDQLFLRYGPLCDKCTE